MGLHVLLAEHQEVLRRDLRALLQNDQSIFSVVEVTTEKELRRQVSQHYWDLVMADQTLITDMCFLPGGKFAILASEINILHLREAYVCGACAYFTMDISADLISLLLRYRGQGFILGPTITPWLMMHVFNQPFPPFNEELLTPREKEIVSLLRSGISRAAIARQLCIADTTVKTHLKNIVRKRETHLNPDHPLRAIPETGRNISLGFAKKLTISAFGADESSC